MVPIWAPFSLGFNTLFANYASKLGMIEKRSCSLQTKVTRFELGLAHFKLNQLCTSNLTAKQTIAMMKLTSSIGLVNHGLDYASPCIDEP